jgi:hypothetical protein
MEYETFRTALVLFAASEAWPPFCRWQRFRWNMTGKKIALKDPKVELLDKANQMLDRRMIQIYPRSPFIEAQRARSGQKSRNRLRLCDRLRAGRIPSPKARPLLPSPSVTN